VPNGPARATRQATPLRQLHSTPSGLDPDHVAERRSVYGPNTLTKERTTALRVLARQFESPLVCLLAVTARLFSFAGLSAVQSGFIALWLVGYFIALDLLKVSYYKLVR
jgi:P-type Mg2+ transporter